MHAEVLNRTTHRTIHAHLATRPASEPFTCHKVIPIGAALIITKVVVTCCCLWLGSKWDQAISIPFTSWSRDQDETSTHQHIFSATKEVWHSFHPLNHCKIKQSRASEGNNQATKARSGYLILVTMLLHAVSKWLPLQSSLALVYTKYWSRLCSIHCNPMRLQNVT